MKSILACILLCLSTASAIRETRGVVSQFKAAYHPDHLTSPNPRDVTMQIRLDGPTSPDKEPAGARFEHVTEATEGRFCASVLTQSVSGNAFAIYLTSQEPKDRATEKWDEIDFEFVGKDPTSVWTNLFHDGNDVGQGRSIPLGFNSDEKRARYCINWKVGDRAEFFVDGISKRNASLAGWTKALHATISFWGGKPEGNQFVDFTGQQMLPAGKSIVGTAARILLELGGTTGPSKIEIA